MFLVSDIEAFWTVSLYKVGYILVTDFFNRCIQSAECMNRNLKFRRKIKKIVFKFLFYICSMERVYCNRYNIIKFNKSFKTDGSMGYNGGLRL